MQTNFKVLLSTTLLIIMNGVGNAATVTVPNTFTSGTAAKASEVNANFQALATGINNLAAQSGINFSKPCVTSDLNGTWDFFVVVHGTIPQISQGNIVFNNGVFTSGTFAYVLISNGQIGSSTVTSFTVTGTATCAFTGVMTTSTGAVINFTFAMDATRGNMAGLATSTGLYGSVSGVRVY